MPGTLGFVITPSTLSDDYDWQLFDITGKNPNDVYTNPALFVACNWSGEGGVTGAGVTGRSLGVCGGLGQPLFSSMPVLQVGHEYLLLISHFSPGQSGYNLEFKGGTANITDPVTPALKSVNYRCLNNTIGVKLSKKMQCKSLSANGSEFTLNTVVAKVLSATGVNCNNGFDMDSVILTLDRPLPEGTYTLKVQGGIDGNSILDACNQPLLATMDFTVPKQLPVPFDKMVQPGCAPDKIQLQFSAPIRCNSLAANGSDFMINGPQVVTVTGFTANCDANGLATEVTLSLSARIITGGNYQVVLQAGTDGNTILSECGVPTTAGAAIPFTLVEQPFVPFTGPITVTCQPDTLQFTLPASVQCNSVAADGSDFLITGTLPIGITGATIRCDGNNQGTVITVKLDKPIPTAGNFMLTLKRGTDGNTLLSECWKETPVGSQRPFETKSPVNPAFTYTVTLDCEKDTVHLSHDGNNGANDWLWIFDGQSTATGQTAIKAYDNFDPKDIKLVVSNGVCKDSSVERIVFSNAMKADFTMSTDILCPQDAVTFTNKSTGNIISYRWEFGNGVISRVFTPLAQRYPMNPRDVIYQVKLITENDMHCFDTATYPLKVVTSCYIDVPTAFTPNGDGQNDFLYPLNGYKATNLKFTVYNRLGQLIFETTDWTRKWDGSFNGRPQAAGTFFWILSYTHKENGQKVFLKGSTLLLR